MAEAEVRRAFDARREALRDAELCETTKLRVEHAAQVERLQRRVVAAALCASGGEQVRGTHFSLPTRHLSSRTNDPDLPHPSQVSTKVHALGHLAKLKIAQGDYSAAWDARNAANRLREAERLAAERDVAEKPESAVAVGGLLATQERELRDLRVAHRARRLRLERQIADELQRRGLPPDAGAVAGVRAEWARERRGGADDRCRPPLALAPPGPSWAPGASYPSPWFPSPRSPSSPEAPSPGASSPSPWSPSPWFPSPRSPSPEPPAFRDDPPLTPSWGAFRTPARTRPSAAFRGATAAFLRATSGDDASATTREDPRGDSRGVRGAAAAFASGLVDPESRARAADEETPDAARAATAASASSVVVTIASSSSSPSPRASPVGFGARRTWLRSPPPPASRAPRSWIPVLRPGDSDVASSTDRPTVDVPRLTIPPEETRSREVEDWRREQPLDAPRADDGVSANRARAVAVSRARDPATRAAAARGYGEYLDGDRATRGFSDGRGVSRTSAPATKTKTNADAFLRAGERAGDGTAPSVHGSDAESVRDSDEDSDDDPGDVWARHAEAFRAPVLGRSGASAQLEPREIPSRRVSFPPGEKIESSVQTGERAVDAAVTRAFAGDAAAEAAATTEGDENEAPDEEDTPTRGRARGRAPTGEFFRRRRGAKSRGEGLPSRAADATPLRVQT